MNAASRTPFYLDHMREAIDRATAYLAPFDSAAAFANDQQALDAVIRAIEILGEAANKISQSDAAFITLHSDIPWQQMRTMRNKMIHDYFSVDALVVWQTVKADLPPLRARIVSLLA